MALSCGLMATCHQRGIYYTVAISGDLSRVPCLVARKQSSYKPYKDVLRSSITVTPIGKDSYAGILIDGDQRFIIEGNIVTHNTSKQAEADWILGIGKVHDPGYENLRYLHLSKNKLPGGLESIPEQRHAKREVLINPMIARYESI